MRKQVLTTTCDNCGHEEWVEYESVDPDSTLPKNWMHVAGTRNGGLIFDLDLCPQCTMMILAAGGRMPASIKTEKSKAMEVGSPEHDAFIEQETMKMAIEDERIRKIDLLSDTAKAFLDRMPESDALYLISNQNWSHDRMELFDGYRKLVFKGEKMTGVYEYLKEKWNVK